MCSINDFEIERIELVNSIRSRGITCERVLDAIGKVERHLFMDYRFVKKSYQDNAFPIDCGQTISQPFTVAYQTQLLDVFDNCDVLEIGTGSGYQTAILLQMGANVFSIERQKGLYNKVISRFEECQNVKIIFGDGYLGLPQYAPFDRILITAAIEEIPQTLIDQLKIGGKLVAPVGKIGQQTMVLIKKTGSNSTEKSTFGNFSFVPMLHGVDNDI